MAKVSKSPKGGAPNPGPGIKNKGSIASKMATAGQKLAKGGKRK